MIVVWHRVPSDWRTIENQKNSCNPFPWIGQSNSRLRPRLRRLLLLSIRRAWQMLARGVPSARVVCT